MKQCPTQHELTSFLSGACSDEDSRRIEQHVESCARCCEWCMNAPAQDKLLSELRDVLDSQSREGKSGGTSSSEQSASAVEAAVGSTWPIVDGYVIEEELGRGGMGVVYRAQQESTNRRVALKLLLQGRFASTKARRRFEREVELAAQLNHPNIVTILESGIARGRYYFAMQYVDGRRLDRFQKPGAGKPRETLRLFAAVCDAVSFAHQRGVIHRDIKPSNVIVDATGQPHILDFGLAKAADNTKKPDEEHSLLSMPGELMGTLPYMSPEQTTGVAGNVDIRSDVYSLGVMLFRQLTARYPYEVIGPVHDVVRNINEASPPKPASLRRGLDDEIDTIVLKSLAKEPGRRYQSADALARDIKSYLSGEPIEAKRDSSTYILRKLAYRHRLPLAAAVVVLLALAVSLIALIQQRQAKRAAAVATAMTNVMADPAAASDVLRSSDSELTAEARSRLAHFLTSPAENERRAGARGGLLASMPEFWVSVDGGALWRGGEWLDVLLLPRTLVEDAVPQLIRMADQGSARQRYVAFCLLGHVASESDLETRNLCARAATTEPSPGAAAAAEWAARQLGADFAPTSRDEVVVDDVSGLVFSPISGVDSFYRGAAADDPDAHPDEARAAKPVALEPFRMSRTELTCAAIEPFLVAVRTDNDLVVTARERRTVERIAGKITQLRTGGQFATGQVDRMAAPWVSINVARRYCAWLSHRGLTADPPRRYRLPTEAEWEHASRAGGDGRFCYGDNERYMRYFANGNGQLDHHVTALRMPNFFGMFDMHGGVWEWCDTRYPTSLLPGRHDDGLELWVMKGGAFYSPAVRCRTTQRNMAEAEVSTDYNGVRIVVELLKR